MHVADQQGEVDPVLLPVTCTMLCMNESLFAVASGWLFLP